MIKNLILWIINSYRRYISIIIPARCRYYPSCSLYGKQAMLWHDTTKGLWLVIRRVASCHPWGGSGVDFVPLPLYRYHYQISSLTVCKVACDNTSYVARLNFLMNK
ncbi:hypothetical protein SAMN02745664_102157 [Moraxella cuniculi DSM 21768]|uniref:Putative membrane protein insertion efficiency factor n=2 Tax=Moraxella cuniculi TaxID=34061 RepID=A0A1N7DVN9_9GAMM|nr:membrane protein insertion efficiency factor YidD [Moraxella cuniculi]OOS07400.1 membrane protein insertion efficiency factor YidD [Moraxella cuniculi]SIR79886.1 hypothetical protein SAMN02745664_102157 [Moraxella cuniculi DSM 21768]VEG12579.1 Putative membrane protein insertion efficiency factor [Moraxella cuniculi]